MKSTLAILTSVTIMVVLAGCRAPIPTLRTSQLLSALGSTRVPPPATRSFATASNYNSGSATPTANSSSSADGWRTATRPVEANATEGNSGNARLVPQASAASTSNRFTQQAPDSPVQPASYVTTSGTSAQARVIGEGDATIRLNGMHANDATSNTPPNAFVPATSIAPLPSRGTSQPGSATLRDAGAGSASLNWRTRT